MLARRRLQHDIIGVLEKGGPQRFVEGPLVRWACQLPVPARLLLLQSSVQRGFVNGRAAPRREQARVDDILLLLSRFPLCLELQCFVQGALPAKATLVS